MQGHPKAKTLKTSPLLFPELCVALFEGTTATGCRAYAPSSTRKRVSVISSSSFSNFHTIEDADDEDAEKEGPTIDKSTTNPSNVDRASPVSSRPSKKNKTKVDMDELAVDLKDALRVLTTPQLFNHPPLHKSTQLGMPVLNG